jgi:hypothetical protein
VTVADTRLIKLPAAGARSVAVIICSYEERESFAPFHHVNTMRSRCLHMERVTPLCRGHLADQAWQVGY